MFTLWVGINCHDWCEIVINLFSADDGNIWEASDGVLAVLLVAHWDGILHYKSSCTVYVHTLLTKLLKKKQLWICNH